MPLSNIILNLLFSCLALASQQEPLLSWSDSTGKDDLIKRLTTAEIVPDLIDSFAPQVKLYLEWPNATASYGNTIDPDELQEQPSVSLAYWPDETDSGIDASTKKKQHHRDAQYIVVLTDPDAPSYKDPKWSQVCHWIVAGIPIEAPAFDTTSHSPHSIVEYKPPGPPPKTGPHRYVSFALAPLNRTTEKLRLSKPADRKHWGYDGERAGVREWAAENGLGVMGANFIYAQNHKQ